MVILACYKEKAHEMSCFDFSGGLMVIQGSAGEDLLSFMVMYSAGMLLSTWYQVCDSNPFLQSNWIMGQKLKTRQPFFQNKNKDIRRWMYDIDKY